MKKMGFTLLFIISAGLVFAGFRSVKLNKTETPPDLAQQISIQQVHPTPLPPSIKEAPPTCNDGAKIKYLNGGVAVTASCGYFIIRSKANFGLTVGGIEVIGFMSETWDLTSPQVLHFKTYNQAQEEFCQSVADGFYPMPDSRKLFPCP